MHGTGPGQTPVPVTGLGGLVTLARPETVPEGASPRCYDWDFDVGSGHTRDGLTNVYTMVDEEVGPNAVGAALSSTWNTPGNIVSGHYTSFAPVSADNSLILNTFTFSLPGTDQISGVILDLSGYSNSPASIQAQLLVNGILVGIPKVVALPQALGTVILGSPTDLWGTTLSADQVNALTFGVQITAISTGFGGATAFLNGASITLGVSTGTSNFQYITTFTDQQGNVRNLSLDADGNFWVENVTVAPRTMTLARSGITPNSLVTSAQGPGVQFFTFTDGFKGIDMPIQYTPNWTDRITQVGPGQAPTFTPVTSSDTNYPIVSITQPPQKSQGFARFLQSQGTGNTSPGLVVTIYYLDLTVAPGPDPDLVAAINSGFPVYLWASFVNGGGGGVGNPNMTAQVVGPITIGEGDPPNLRRNFAYFQFTLAAGSPAYNYTNGSSNSNVVTYQRTLATLTTMGPVPNLVPGNQITVGGVTPSSWDGAWRITETPNSSEMAISGSQVTSGVATLNYAVTNDTSPPAAGQLVTITNTLNAGGALNVSQATIVSSTGGSTGTFTIGVSVPDFAFEAESGLATTAGTIFDFDPGAEEGNGSSSNPIFGNGTGGNLVYNASGLFIDPGTYQGTMGFITRNGLWTFPAPPVVFTVPENTTSINVAGMLTGPPNVVARYIAITEAGQLGVPGGNFFVLPVPVTFYQLNVKYTATATVINDNVTMATTLFFTGVVLDSAERIDQYGYNLFNCIEIGDPGWTINYASRQWFGLCINKLQSFVNLSFDGGPSSGTPPGWTVPDAFGSVVPSPKFGNSYYISNNGLTLAITNTVSSGGTATYTYTVAGNNNPSIGDPVTVTGTTNGSGAFNVTAAAITGVNTGAGTFTIALVGSYTSQAEAGQAMVTGTLPMAGLIQQSAYQDWELQPIIEPNTTYSVRVTAANPSGNQTGSLVIALVSAGVILGSYTLPLASMTTNLAIYTGTLLINELTIVQPGTTIQLYAQNLGNGADMLVDRFDVFPTEIPVLTTTVFGSYVGLPEQIDGVTGTVGFSSENQQPVNGAMVLYDTFYGLKAWSGKAPGSSLYSLQKTSDLEPAQWDEPEVAQRSGGAIGPLAFDLGEQWFVGASRAGLYLFVGGQPGKISQEIWQVWNAINWSAGQTIWVKVDVNLRKIYVGVPMATPNFWLPNAAVNANPTSPNVILMCNFQGIDSGEELKAMPQMHTTMFGTLTAIDMRRKWSIWQIPAPYANLIQTAEDIELYICNGRGNSKVYELDPLATTDDGITIDSLYTSAGMPEFSKRAQMPQLGKNRVRWGYMTATVESPGNIQVTLYANRLPGPGNPPVASWQMPGGWTPGQPFNDDAESPLNFAGTRTFVEFRENDGLGGFTLANLVLYGEKDAWNQMRGRTGP